MELLEISLFHIPPTPTSLPNSSDFLQKYILNLSTSLCFPLQATIISHLNNCNNLLPSPPLPILPLSIYFFTINSPGYSLPLLKCLQRLSTAVRKTFKLIIIASKALWLDLCLAFRFPLSCSPLSPLHFWHTGLLAAPRWSQIFPPQVLCLCLKDSPYPTIASSHLVYFLHNTYIFNLNFSLVFWMCPSFSH